MVGLNVLKGIGYTAGLVVAGAVVIVGGLFWLAGTLFFGAIAAITDS